MEFKDKRVIITAGAGGIGRETTRLFVEAGAKVFICDVDKTALENTLSSFDNVSGARVDVSDPDQFKSFFSKADEYLGGLDIMVNNAGGNLDRKTYSLPEISLDKFDEQLHLNMKTKFLSGRAIV